MGAARNLAAERNFARRALTDGLLTGARDLIHGDTAGALRTAALLAALVLAGTGYAVGWIASAVRVGGRRPT